MSKILISKLNNKEYNRNYKKDYYFIVVNKNNTNEIIINSIKGLKILNPNINNLPFQICWQKNKEYVYENINTKIKLFIKCLRDTKKDWKHDFIKNFRKRKYSFIECSQPLKKRKKY